MCPDWELSPHLPWWRAHADQLSLRPGLTGSSGRPWHCAGTRPPVSPEEALPREVRKPRLFFPGGSWLAPPQITAPYGCPESTWLLPAPLTDRGVDSLVLHRARPWGGPAAGTPAWREAAAGPSSQSSLAAPPGHGGNLARLQGFWPERQTRGGPRLEPDGPVLPRAGPRRAAGSARGAVIGIGAGPRAEEAPFRQLACRRRGPFCVTRACTSAERRPCPTRLP